MENLGKKTRTADASITNRIQELEDRISVINDTIEKINTSVQENIKTKRLLTKAT